MDESKERRVEAAAEAARDQQQKALTSLAHCLSRSNVMRVHHNVLVQEVLDAGGIDHFTDLKKHRFSAYVCFWFASLANVVERFQQLVRAGTLPPSDTLDGLLGADFLDLVKPFRNAVAHCSDHDDERVLELLANPHTIPDRAEAIAHAFKEYIDLHRQPSGPPA